MVCKFIKNLPRKASLVAQQSRICLPVQETQVQSPVQEDPTCCGATKPVHHSYWAHALEPVSCVPQSLRPATRSYCSEKHACCNQRGAPACCSQREFVHSNEDPVQSKINTLIKLYIFTKEPAKLVVVTHVTDGFFGFRYLQWFQYMFSITVVPGSFALPPQKKTKQSLCRFH